MTEVNALKESLFISYNQANKNWAEWIADQLEKTGYTTRIQAWDFRPGNNFIIEMQSASKKATRTIFVASSHSMRSDFVSTEWAARFREDPSGKNRKLIPVVVEDCEIEGLLGSIVYIDLRGLSETEAAKSLIDGVKDGRNKPADVPFPNLPQVPNEMPEPLASKSLKAEENQYDTTSEFQGADGAQYNDGRRAYYESAARIRWLRDSLEFFDDRLAFAFPGLRGVGIFTGSAAVECLTALLRPPLLIESSHGLKNAPLYWWRGSRGSHIDRFEVLDKEQGRCLLGNDELLVDKVAGYRSPYGYRSFVYVLARKDQPTGVYNGLSNGVVSINGYTFETTGYWRGHYVRAEERDDGYGIIDGKRVALINSEWRNRYLSAYNVFISCQMSVLNTVDASLESLCSRLLRGKITIQTATREIEARPLSSRLHGDYEQFDYI